MFKKFFKGFIFCLIILSPGISIANTPGFLPMDAGRVSIQGLSPDVFGTLSITTGSNTVDVSKDVIVRFNCNYPVTYYFGSGTAWPIPANTDEYSIIPTGKTTLTIYSNINPTTCSIQEGRK